MRTISVLLLTLAMTGCIWGKKDPVVMPPNEIEKQEFHPPSIRPVQLNTAMTFKTLTPDTSGEILSDGNYAYQCLSWNDYLILGQNMQSILSKFDEYEGLTCYYRRDLKEFRCEKFNIPARKQEDNEDE